MKTFVTILQGLFLLGVAGCAITIPLCAWKFFSVVFESNQDAEAAEEQEKSAPGADERAS